MRRFIMICLTLVIITFYLTSCGILESEFNDDKPDPFEVFMERVKKEESYQMTIELTNVWEYERITIFGMVDGNIAYIPVAEPIYQEARYIEYLDGYNFEYTKNEYGKWVKKKTTEDNNVDMMKSNIFDIENYELTSNNGEKATYVQKNNVIFEYFLNAVLTVDKDTCVIEADMSAADFSCDIKILVSKLGKVNLELPEAMLIITDTT